MRVYAVSRFDSQRSASGPGGAHGAAHWTGDGAQLGVAMTGCGIMAVCVVSVSCTILHIIAHFCAGCRMSVLCTCAAVSRTCTVRARPIYTSANTLLTIMPLSLWF